MAFPNSGEATGFQENQGKIASPEYPSVLTQQPPVQYGERTGFQAIITSSWVLRWAAMPTTYAHYRQIRKHPTVALARILCAAPVLAAEWSVKAHDGASPEWVRLIQDTFMPMRERFLEPALLFGNIDFGYQGFEKVFDQADGYDKLVKLKPLLQDITEICIGHRGEFLGFRQWGTELGLANALHVGFRIEGSYLYGIPLLENIRETHRDWLECNEGAKRYDKHVAGAHWIVQYPDVLVTHNGVKNVPAGVVAKELLSTLESAGGAAVPRDVAAFMSQLNANDPGWIIDLKATGTQEQAGFVDRLNYLDKLLCRGLLLPERSVLEGTHGTKEEAETHLDAAMVTKDLEHRYCTAELNRQAVDEVLVLNFGEAARGQVELEAAPIVDSKREFFKDLYKQVLANPQAAVEEFSKMDFDSIRDALGIPKAKETDKPNTFQEMAEENRINRMNPPQPGMNGNGRPPSDDPWGDGGDGGGWDGGNGSGPQVARFTNRAPLELAGTEEVSQPPWKEHYTRSSLPSWAYTEEDEDEPEPEPEYGPDLNKSVPIGEGDTLHFTATPTDNERSLTGRYGPEVESIRQRYRLDFPHEFGFGRRKVEPLKSTVSRYRVTGQGKAGLIMSHAVQAARELLQQKRPMLVYFTGEEPSRQKAYEHLARRMVRKSADAGAGEGEYRAFRDATDPSVFHIAHKAIADSPLYAKMFPYMEEIEAREKVAMANPGYRIPQFLRTRRGARFANDPPEGGGEASSLNPYQQADVHALAQKLAANGNEASINMIVPSGKWREQPPHGENSEHKTRLAEAVANAVSSGAIQKHPDKTKMGRALYIPGEKFEHFNAPMQNAPRSGRGGSHGGGGRWSEATEPPSPESAKFIEQAGLHPRQLADVQAIVRMMQARGGRLGAGAIDEMRGKWRSTPPHVPEGGFTTRHAEAVGVAMKHGVIQKDSPELHPSGKVPYIAGPNYQHFLVPGETAVKAPAIAAIEHGGYTPTGWEDYDPFADLGLDLPEDKWPKFPGKQKEINVSRFAKALAKGDAPEGFEYHPKDIRDMVALMDSIENGHYGERARAIAPNRLRKSRNSPRWIDDPRDPRSEAETHYDDIIKKLAESGAIHEAPSRIPGRVAAYAPKAGEAYDYLHGLGAASIQPRVRQVKQPAGERLTKEQAWHKEIADTAQSITGLLKGTAAEKAQQETSSQAQREWQKALSQDFGQDIRERLRHEGKTRHADLADKITRTGNLLHEALQTYNPAIDGDFDRWYSRAHDAAARIAYHEILAETEPVAKYKGKSLDAPVKTKGGDTGGSLESMTGGDVKTNIEALQESKGKMEVVRRRAARHLDHLIRDTSPKTRDGRIVLEGLNVEVAQKMGTGAWLYLKRMLHGVPPEEARAKWLAGNKSINAESRFEKMRNRIIDMARSRFADSDPDEKIRLAHDLMEVLLDTTENQANPVKAANRSPGKSLSPGYLILSNQRRQKAAREGGLLL